MKQKSNKAKRNKNWYTSNTSKLTQYNKEIRKAKKLHFQNFCKNIIFTCLAAQLNLVVAKGGTNPTMTLRKSDQTYTEREEKRVTLLLEVHFPGSDLILRDVEVVATTNHSKSLCREDCDKKIFTKQLLE